MTSLQPTQAQCLGCIRKGATVTTSNMIAVKLLSSYLIGTYDGYKTNIPICWIILALLYYTAANALTNEAYTSPHGSIKLHLGV